MPVTDLMNDSCDIYFAKTEIKEQGYGLSSQEEIDFSEKPDIEDQKCHVKFKQIEIIENNMNRQVSQQNHIDFPLGVEIHRNDKVIDKSTGITYYISILQNIRGNRLRAQIVTRKEFL